MKKFRNHCVEDIWLCRGCDKPCVLFCNYPNHIECDDMDFIELRDDDLKKDMYYAINNVLEKYWPDIVGDEDECEANSNTD